MALTNWNDILNKPKGIDQIEEIALEVSELSSSVLSIGGDVQELELSVADLSASVLSINEEIESLKGWSAGDKLYEDDAMTVIGYTNSRLNLAYIRINGHGAAPTSTSLSAEINNKYRPLNNETYNRGRYDSELTVTYNIGTNKTTFNIGLLNTSYQWYNGTLLYVTDPIVTRSEETTETKKKTTKKK